MNKKLPDIFDYIDFRKFLEEYRQARAQYDSGFTHYYVCYRLGMKKSRSYFNNIIKGRKNIGPETVDKLIGLLGLKTEEANYFRALINYGQTNSSSEKEFYFDQIIALNNTPKRIIDETTYEYFREWYHPVIRELLETIDFKGQYAWIAKKLRPSITAQEARHSIWLLQKLGLVALNSNGFLKPTDKVIATPDQVVNHMIQQYQVKSLERGQNAIMEGPSNHKTSTLTVSVSNKGLERIVQKMDQLRSFIRSIAHKDDGDDKNVFEFIVHAHKQTS
ncbi:MAG: TIGR02147 family protein [Chitinispirillaceae bacterium]